MRIRSIRACAIDASFAAQKLLTKRVASPMSRWPEYATSRSTWMWPTRKVITRIETTDGVVGWSVTNGGEVVELIVNAQLARLLTGRVADEVEDAWDLSFAALMPFDRSGFAMMAIAAVDVALWDIRAKSHQTPLATLLGGDPDAIQHAYVTAADPQEFRESGHWGLKSATPFGLEAGDEGLRQNVALMQRFRDAAGDRPIMADAYLAWDADYTLRFVDAVADLDLYWIEDPIPPLDLSGLEMVKRRLDGRTRLALGNFCFHRWDCFELMKAGLVDILQPDVAWSGGITENLRILEAAKRNGVPVFLHNTCEQPWALALASAMPDSIVERVHRGAESPMYTLMGPDPARPDGTVTLAGYHAGNTPPNLVTSRFDDPT